MVVQKQHNFSAVSGGELAHTAISRGNTHHFDFRIFFCNTGVKLGFFIYAVKPKLNEFLSFVLGAGQHNGVGPGFIPIVNFESEGYALPKLILGFVAEKFKRNRGVRKVSFERDSIQQECAQD